MKDEQEIKSPAAATWRTFSAIRRDNGKTIVGIELDLSRARTLPQRGHGILEFSPGESLRVGLSLIRSGLRAWLLALFLRR